MSENDKAGPVPVVESDAGTAELTHALLLYGARSSSGVDGVAHATLHSVWKSEIQPGQLLKLATAQEILGRLMGNTESSWSFHDEFVIASAPTALAWWTPERVVMTHFSEQSGAPSGEAKHPPMLWVVNGSELAVWSLMRNERPALGDIVAHAVQMNVWKSGRVCQGSMKKPGGVNRMQWMKSFDISRYTHPNDGDDWQTGHEQGTRAFWRDRVAAKGNEPFPYQLLKPADRTVEQAITGVKR